MFFKFGGSRACGRARQNGQRFLGASRAVVCIEAAGSVRCVWKFSNRVSGNLVRPTKLPRQAIYSAAHEVPRPRVRIRPRRRFRMKPARNPIAPTDGINRPLILH